MVNSWKSLNFHWNYSSKLMKWINEKGSGAVNAGKNGSPWQRFPCISSGVNKEQKVVPIMKRLPWQPQGSIQIEWGPRWNIHFHQRRRRRPLSRGINIPPSSSSSSRRVSSRLPFNIYYVILQLFHSSALDWLHLRFDMCVELICIISSSNPR